MKKQLFIFLLALLPFVASAQNDTSRIFQLYGYNGFAVGSIKLTTNPAGKLLFNGQPLTADQQALVDAAKSGSTSGITSGGVYTSLQSTITRLNARMDSLATVLSANAKRAAADSAAKAVRNSGIYAMSIIANDSVGNWVKSIVGGTYFASTAIIVGTVTASTIPITLKAVPNATAYNVYISADSTNYGNSISTSGTSYTFANLTASKKYFIKVTATDGTNTSMGVVASATTLSAASPNSIASTGYSVLDYWTVANKGLAGSEVSFTGGPYVDSQDPGIGYIVGSPAHIVLVNGFKAVHYKFTFYNATVLNGLAFYGGHDGFNGTQVGNNVVFEFDGDLNGYMDIYSNGGQMAFTEVKVEVRN